MSTSRHTVERVVAAISLTILLVAVGAGGWLVGHVATYDAVGHQAHGQEHGHALPSHVYLEPLGQFAALGIVVGIAATFVALVLTRRVLVNAVQRTRRSPTPWIMAAVVPSATFLAVEVAEGSTASLGATGLALGAPMQALLGLAAFALVRVVVLALARAVEQLVARPGAYERPIDHPLQAGRPLVQHVRRRTPMSDNAALRGPPSTRGPIHLMA